MLGRAASCIDEVPIKQAFTYYYKYNDNYPN